ncbi:AraC family ligand binding domain-containing protein [Paenibacillus sp. GCM10027627]|uniref:AraC family ligand binding domain-containing protein n=1 Tax=unclassified Paenibacillus TaxID=185978 RepID=UPI00363B6293
MEQNIKDLCGIDFPNMEWTTWEKPGANGRVKMCFVGNKRLRLLELPPGFNEENWCSKGHIGYVLQGEFTIHYSDRQVACSPGMGFVIPDGDPHRSQGMLEGPTVVFVIDEAS